MTVLDASVLIAHLAHDDPHRERAAEVLASLDGPLPVSIVTLAEVLVGPTRAGMAGPVAGALRDLGVQEVPLGPDAAGRLAVLRVDTGLKLPDCCVLLAAEDVGAHGIATFDARLAGAARERGLVVR
ncbi:type II toxin-antitoxin system VapC family toxin [Patulibacter sp. S7RM1-6]